MVDIVINNDALDDRAGPGSTRGQGAGPLLKSPGPEPVWARPALQMSGSTTWPDRVGLGRPLGQLGLALPVDSVHTKLCGCIISMGSLDTFKRNQSYSWEMMIGQ